MLLLLKQAQLKIQQEDTSERIYFNGDNIFEWEF